MDAMIMIHEAGLEHTDFHPYNVLSRSDGGIRIIDFDEAVPHKCERKLKIIQYAYAPSEDDFGCDELYYVAGELELWTPST